MKGDFSRWTFHPEKHYHGVLKQQGRVDLDSDWNEQGAITAHRVETEALDVIGPCGAPAGAAGFGLHAGPKNAAVSITKKALIESDKIEAVDYTIGKKPAPAKGETLIIGAGRAYVDGILIANENDLAIDAQPDLPGYSLPDAPGYYLAYLEVFLRHITPLDDAGIREIALGGPDTCTRAKTVWQVKLLPLGKQPDYAESWKKLTALPTGQLAARAEPDAAAATPCDLPPKAGYQRLENQLYRVEIHTGSSPGPATFKWSRENGSIAAAVVSWLPESPDRITIGSTGHDSALGFATGDWIEITDDAHDLTFQPGTLVQIQKVDGNTLSVETTGSVAGLDPNLFAHNPKVRRWEAAGNSAALAKVEHDSWLGLESGVQVGFSSGSYVTGDYWMIPARTLTGDVDWPIQDEKPVFEAPRGVRRHYCQLAVVQLQGGAWSVVQTCLPVFAPLTSVPIHPAMHVKSLNFIGRDGKPKPIDNSDTIPAKGLSAVEVLFDEPVSGVCAQPATFFITVHVPHLVPQGKGAPLRTGLETLILDAEVTLSAGGSGLQLKPGAGAVQYLEQVTAGGDRVWAQLILKGAKIWSRDDPDMYLDGVAFGMSKLDKIALRLASGGGRPGSDFEMWFWLSRG